MRLLFCIVTLAALSLTALAQEGVEEDARQPARPDSVSIMRSASEALDALDALELRVHSRGVGTLSTRVPETEGSVTLRRAGTRDPVGWTFRIEGTARRGDQTRTLLTAYDGREVRSVRQHEEAVIESTWENAGEPMSDGAEWALTWLVRWRQLVGQPFGGEGRPFITRYEGLSKVDGVVCDVVYVDYSETADPNLYSAWWYIAQDDALPRRLEMHMVDHRHGDGFLIVTMSDYNTSAAVDTQAFSLQTPEGFELRAAERPVQVGRTRTRPAGVPFGELAPDWTLEDPTGREHTLSDYRGRVVVMHFWATWCPPCRRAMPGLQQLHEQFAERGLVVFGVNSWESGDPVSYMQGEGLTYTLLLDGDSIVAPYMVNALPTIYVISPDGRVAHHSVGSAAGLEEVIEALLP